MKCQYCNSEIPDNSSFCPNCGKPVTKSNAAGGRGTTTGNIQPDFFYTAEAAQTPPAYSASSPDTSSHPNLVSCVYDFRTADHSAV